MKGYLIEDKVFKAVNKNFIYFKNKNISKKILRLLKKIILHSYLFVTKKRIKEIIDIRFRDPINENKIPFLILAEEKVKE